MIYIMYGMNQKPENEKKMADGGLALTSAPMNTNIQNQGGDGSVQNGGVVSNMTPQSNFQAQLAPTQQVDYMPALNTGVGTITGNIANQNNLGNMFMNQATGQGGPSVAQTELSNATGRNVAGQTAMMASNRNASANAGMTARNAARVGGDVQQQAAGQASTMKAQETQQAYQNLMNLYNNVGQEGQSLFGTSAGAINAQNTNMVNNYAQSQGINAQTAAQNAQGERVMLGNMVQGFTNGMSSMMGGMGMMSEGGEVPSSFCSPNMKENYQKMSMGGMPSLGVDTTMPSMDAPQSFAGNELSEEKNDSGGKQGKPALQTESPIQFTMPTMAPSPNIPMSSGSVVPGKANTRGDSERNDTVHALLSPGEGVVPRTAMADPDKAAAFAYQMALKSNRKGKR